MTRLLNAVACLSLACGALSASVPLSSYAKIRDRASGTTPCAKIRDLSAAWRADPANKDDPYPVVPAQLAYECITSVPFNKKDALKIVDQLSMFTKFSSTHSMIKNPPAEYARLVRPGYDFFAALANIRRNVVLSNFKSEYEFAITVSNAVRDTHDEYFDYNMDIFINPFVYGREFYLASVSIDGKLPVLYEYGDLHQEKKANATYKASEITRINGQPAIPWLEKESKKAIIPDLDAAYNTMMRNLAGGHAGYLAISSGYFSGCGEFSSNYPGPDTTLQFANGTTTTAQNYAIVTIPFDGISDGTSFANLWFPQPPPTEDPAPQANTTSSDPAPKANTTISDSYFAKLAPFGYPPPVFFLDTYEAGGYYLEGQYSDVAALVITGIGRGAGYEEFQNSTFKFITEAKAHGKKKLIIDLSCNTSGLTILAYDLFKILFPHADTNALGNRFRAFNTTKLMAQRFSDISDLLPRVPEITNETVSYYNYYTISDDLDLHTNTDINGKPFQDWQHFFGPDLKQNGDAFSSLYQWNLSDVDLPYNAGVSSVHGYGKLAAYANAPQPFSACDITIVSNGQTSGGAAIFAELMRKQGVKFVSLGGRSRRGMTQAIGGTKSSSIHRFEELQQKIKIVIRTSESDEVAELNSTELGLAYDETIFNRGSEQGTAGAISLANAYRDGSNIPINFQYTPANCRMFFTKEMVLDVSAIWKAVADSAWGSKCHCAEGTLQGPGWKQSLHTRELTARELEHTKLVQAWKERLDLKPVVKGSDRKLGIDRRLNNIPGRREH